MRSASKKARSKPTTTRPAPGDWVLVEHGSSAAGVLALVVEAAAGGAMVRKWLAKPKTLAPPAFTPSFRIRGRAPADDLRLNAATAALAAEKQKPNAPQPNEVT